MEQESGGRQLICREDEAPHLSRYEVENVARRAPHYSSLLLRYFNQTFFLKCTDVLLLSFFFLFTVNCPFMDFFFPRHYLHRVVPSLTRKRCSCRRASDDDDTSRHPVPSHHCSLPSPLLCGACAWPSGGGTTSTL